jgi:hypothetical protein
VIFDKFCAKPTPTNLGCQIRAQSFSRFCFTSLQYWTCQALAVGTTALRTHPLAGYIIAGEFEAEQRKVTVARRPPVQA